MLIKKVMATVCLCIHTKKITAHTYALLYTGRRPCAQYSSPQTTNIVCVDFFSLVLSCLVLVSYNSGNMGKMQP